MKTTSRVTLFFNFVAKLILWLITVLLFLLWIIIYSSVIWDFLFLKYSVSLASPRSPMAWKYKAALALGTPPINDGNSVIPSLIARNQLTTKNLVPVALGDLQTLLMSELPSLLSDFLCSSCSGSHLSMCTIIRRSYWKVYHLWDVISESHSPTASNQVWILLGGNRETVFSRVGKQ